MLGSKQFLLTPHRLPLWKRCMSSTQNSTSRQRGHLLRGFLAGTYSQPDEDYTSFDDAYTDLGLVDATLLDDMAVELATKKERSLHIVHGSRLVSVFDVVQHKNHDVVTTRHLILNKRPHLVQTAVAVDHVGARYDASRGVPPPLSETHLGGLALVLPLWRSHTARDNDNADSPPHPHSVLLGAGGCSLAATLVANTNKNTPIVAVEPCNEVMDAAKEWFGAKQIMNENFQLVNALGEEYLATAKDGSIDILIIDAEDGMAPPQSMRTHSFWQETVLPKLAEDAVVGVNVIGEREERSVFQETLAKVMGDTAVVHSVDPPKEACLKGDRHALFFVCIQKTHRGAHPWINPTDFEPLVSNPTAWVRVLKESFAGKE